MRTKSYYLIHPKDLLIKFLSKVDILSKEALDHDQLWESTEGGKSMWSESDYVARAKLSFLINLRLEYKGAQGIDQLFSEGKVSTAMFDKYWDIRQVELSGAVEEISGVILDSNEFELPGIPIVDEWLKSVIRFG